jgi:kanamycin kinase
MVGSCHGGLTAGKGTGQYHRVPGTNEEAVPRPGAPNHAAMTESQSDKLARVHSLDGIAVPGVVRAFAGRFEPELVWRNELGGLTFRFGDRFAKWNPTGSGLDLEREFVRLRWLSGRHPAPRPIELGSDGDGQWLITAALPGKLAIGDEWRARPSAAIRAIAAGLRAIHAVAIDDFPAEWSAQVWFGRHSPLLGSIPPIDEPVLVHGDACAPNTLISDEGIWTGNVDFGALGVGDRWADLAIASMSLDWNFGAGHQAGFFEAYGIEADDDRIRYYRALWDLES